jgi:hypothetical protein
MIECSITGLVKKSKKNIAVTLLTYVRNSNAKINEAQWHLDLATFQKRELASNFGNLFIA